MNIPPLITKLLAEAPLIPFFILPKTIKVPVPLIVRFDPDLNLIPAPSKSSKFSSVSLSIIVEIPSNISLALTLFFITKGPVNELSIFIELRVIVGEVPFFTSIPHSEHVPFIIYSSFDVRVTMFLFIL